MDLTLSVRLEELLVKIAPMYRGMRDAIQNKPYETILKALQNRLPKGAEVFAYNHKDMGDRCLSQLQADGYDLELIISDLKILIDKGE